MKGSTSYERALHCLDVEDDQDDWNLRGHYARLATVYALLDIGATLNRIAEVVERNELI